MTDPSLSDLHHLLCQSIERSRPHGLDRPVTVAEIYQDLVPYRLVRGVLDYPQNADYELALMRLLAGQDGRLRLEPAQAREELAAELSMTNPNVALYRKFAACDVWVTPAEPRQQPDGPAADHSAPPAEPPAPSSTEAAEDESDGPAALPFPPRGFRPPNRPRVETTEPAASAAEECRFCQGRLPSQREARFCPHCGEDQTRRPCASCGETLDRSWRFCIACGHPAR